MNGLGSQGKPSMVPHGVLVVLNKGDDCAEQERATKDGDIVDELVDSGEGELPPK